jgi:hypothetical protein
VRPSSRTRPGLLAAAALAFVAWRSIDCTGEGDCRRMSDCAPAFACVEGTCELVGAATLAGAADVGPTDAAAE